MGYIPYKVLTDPVKSSTRDTLERLAEIVRKTSGMPPMSDCYINDDGMWVGEEDWEEYGTEKLTYRKATDVEIEIFSKLNELEELMSIHRMSSL